MSSYDDEPINSPLVETIDQLINNCIDDKYLSSENIETVNGFAITQYHDLILKLLKSTKNKTSKYDLMIINTINIYLGVDSEYRRNHQHHLLSILEVYKNRKG